MSWRMSRHSPQCEDGETCESVHLQASLAGHHTEIELTSNQPSVLAGSLTTGRSIPPAGVIRHSGKIKSPVRT